MKHYFGIFLGIAFLIMSIPCFAFAGTSGSTPKETMSAASSSDGQAAENDTVSFKVYNHKTGKVETIAPAIISKVWWLPKCLQAITQRP